MPIRALIFLVALAASPVATLASHHAWSPYFDSQRPFSVTGTVVKVDWVNPVVFVHLRVEDKATGQVTTWAFEGESVNAMRKWNLSGDMFKEGAPLTVIGWMGRPGANLSETVADPELASRVRAERAASAAQFEFSDGRRFPLGSNVPEPLTRQ
jgi:hypothetical protein